MHGRHGRRSHHGPRVDVGDNDPDTGGQSVQWKLRTDSEIEFVPEGQVVGPLRVGAEIRHRRLDLDDDEPPIAA